MPIAGVEAGEGPVDVSPVETVLNVPVLDDIADVIEINEFVTGSGPKGQEH